MTSRRLVCRRRRRRVVVAVGDAPCGVSDYVNLICYKHIMFRTYKQGFRPCSWPQGPRPYFLALALKAVALACFVKLSRGQDQGHDQMSSFLYFQ